MAFITTESRSPLSMAVSLAGSLLRCVATTCLSSGFIPAKRADGAGGSRYFTGTSGTLTNPANDFGTLVRGLNIYGYKTIKAESLVVTQYL
mgnify:CR=1 FL=1